MHIGLYFGSFNPIHVGHLIIASYAKHSTDLKQVWLVPSPQNPLKPARSLLNEYHRLHLVRLAIANDPHLRVSDIEYHLPKPSFTTTTLAYLQEKHPSHKFSMVMGSDSYGNLSNWRNHEQLVANHNIYVYLRPHHPISTPYNKPPIIINAPLLDISSTAIRQMIKQNIPIRYLVPDAVAQEIENNNYYR
jgi:nicotinate-nucleotide adenylyltransferase